jgi:site-specific DNA recombinase
MMTKARIRCAVYTRKSHEDGLEQDFNSLTAQREACLAYIASQKPEGWVAVAAEYDDGGFSGGTLERPAVKRLLADIDAGRIDVVVVYKVDRLTRSLTDFSKIVELLDGKGASFVSVTQAFNTTSSMGRLTLNVLLSFAQFEREVTGERIRDKIAASKAKGMWMGGVVPLGYDSPAEGTQRSLTINRQEAETVRHIYARYLELGSVHVLCDELEASGVRSKTRITQSGKLIGGKVFSRGALFHLLKSPIYRGLIPHKGKTYTGLHEAIIDQDLFEAVQDMLAGNAQRRKQGPTSPGTSLLKGLLYDAGGAPMSPTISYGKLKRAYRYYVSSPLQCGKGSDHSSDHVRRVAAAQIEGVVIDALRKVLGADEAADWVTLKAPLVRVELNAKSVDLLIDADRGVPLDHLMARSLGWATVELEQDSHEIRLSVSGKTIFRGGRIWIIGGAGQHPMKASRVDIKLVKALKAAHAWQLKLNASPLTAQADLTAAQVHPDSYIRQLGQLAFLAPDIQQAILDGHQPAGLTIKRLLASKLPLEWSAQRKALGFAL